MRSLEWSYKELKTTGRGKHIGRFSYYHRVLAESRGDVLTYIEGLVRRLHPARFEFNVVKLDDRSRVTLLLYEEFAVSRFPVLLGALSCDVVRRTAREILYCGRRNPPILHRKELLLPIDHPLVPEAARLTEELERLGAFENPHRIGTRDGWASRLASLGVALDGRRASL